MIYLKKTKKRVKKGLTKGKKIWYYIKAPSGTTAGAKATRSLKTEQETSKKFEVIHGRNTEHAQAVQT